MNLMQIGGKQNKVTRFIELLAQEKVTMYKDRKTGLLKHRKSISVLSARSNNSCHGCES